MQVIDKVPQAELLPALQQVNLEIVINRLHERCQPTVATDMVSLMLLKKHFNQLTTGQLKKIPEMKGYCLIMMSYFGNPTLPF